MTVAHSLMDMLCRSTDLERSPAVSTVTSVQAQNRFGWLHDTVQRVPVSMTPHRPWRKTRAQKQAETHQPLDKGICK